MGTWMEDRFFHLGGYLGSRYLPGCEKFTRVFFSVVQFFDSISRRNYLKCRQLKAHPPWWISPLFRLRRQILNPS